MLTGLSGVLVRAHARASSRTTCSRCGDDGRSTECRRLEMLPIECVVRGYLAGSGLEGLPRDRRRLRPRAARRARRVGASCRSRSSRRRRRRTTGHDENIDRARPPSSSARSASTRSSGVSLELYRFASEHAAARGIILADTKLEFGVDDDGRLVLADEAFTPDSSRFWPADEYAPGGPQPSFDKQFVRDYCETLGWDKTPPGPGAAGRRRRRDARPLRRGVRAPDGDRVRRVPRRPGAWCSGEGDRARPAEGRASSTRRARRCGARCGHLGFAVGDARVGRVVDLELEAADPAEAREQVDAMCRQLLANPLIESYEIELEARVSDAARPRVARRRASPARTTTATRCWALGALGAEAVRVWHAEARAAATSAPSSCPAASRSATTCAAARSRASRR